MLRKDSMKKANVMIDFKNDKTIMFLTTADVIHTDPGHYGILLNLIWEGQLQIVKFIFVLIWRKISGIRKIS